MQPVQGLVDGDQRAAAPKLGEAGDAVWSERDKTHGIQKSQKEEKAGRLEQRKGVRAEKVKKVEKEKKFRILLLNGGEVQKVIETDSEREAGDIWREGYESEGYAAIVYLMGVKLTLRECMEVFGTEAAIDYRRRSGR